MPKIVKVMCVNTGQRFESVKAAAASAGVDKSVMHRHLSGQLRTAGGMVYMRITPNATQEQIEQQRRERIRQICEDNLGILIF